MTYASRQVLQDCNLALEMLQNETDSDRWRVLWAGAVALLRAVGHVLLNVDQAANPMLKKAGNIAHRRWVSGDAQHSIYRDFILNERNSILKEYRSKVHPLEQVDVLVRLTLQNANTGELSYVDQVMPMDENMFKPMVEGYGEGDDARDIYEEALNWWERELSAIEAEAKTTYDDAEAP
jgi:hypothetical protein